MFSGTKYTNETYYVRKLCLLWPVCGWHRSPVTKHQLRQVPSCQSHLSKFLLHCPHERWDLPVENWDPQMAPLLEHHPETPKRLGKLYCIVLSSQQLEIASLVHKREFQHTLSRISSQYSSYKGWLLKLKLLKLGWFALLKYYSFVLIYIFIITCYHHPVCLFSLNSEPSLQAKSDTPIQSFHATLVALTGTCSCLLVYLNYIIAR